MIWRSLAAISSAVLILLTSAVQTAGTGATALGAAGGRATAPRAVATFDEIPKPAALPDGTLAAFFLRTVEGVQQITARFSRDNGETWGEPVLQFKLPPEQGGFGYFVVLVDRQGEFHLFFLNDANTGIIRPPADGQRPARDRLDIWHVRSVAGRQKWEPAKRIWEGRAADLQSVIQLRNGRIVLPISYMTGRSWRNRGEGFYAFTYTGKFTTTTLYSDDGGQSWRQSPAALQVPTPDITTILGGVEPILIELKDGRVWMLIRSQMGRFYESFSRDGVAWSRPAPSQITSSDAPAGLVRLRNGRILLIWNNTLRFPYAYGGRHVLHAAVSEDEGQTWRGYREVARDPHRTEPSPPSGDHGVSYPFPALTADGKVIFSLWVETGKERSIWKLDPDWLYETTQADDFSAGLGAWSNFGTKGVEAVAHPDKPGGRALSLRKPAGDWPAAAVWNFPAGDRGRLRLRVLVKPKAGPALVGLADHFSPPFDEVDQFHNLYNLTIGPGGRLTETARLEPNRWHDLELNWDTARRECRVLLDGRTVATLPQLRDSAAGANYLRLRSAAADKDEAGLLVESVTADVSQGW